MSQITPYPFQLADASALREHGFNGIVVAETGAGKTIIAAETMRQSGAPTKLIIAPQGTHESVWRATITGRENSEGEWVTGLDPEARVQRIDGSARGKEAFADLEFSLPGYYMMTPQLFTRWNGKAHKLMHLRPDLTLVDEFHLLANRDSTGGKSVMRLGTVSGARIAMSGTFVRNRFENLWTGMRFVYPDRNGAGDIADIAANRWIDDNCATKYDHFAPGNRVVVGELHPGEFALRVPCWRQHFKRAECCEFHPEGFLAHLPEPIVIRETVTLTSGQIRAMRQMKEDYLSYLEVKTDEWKALPAQERKKKPLVTKMPIVRETRLSQMSLAMPSIEPRRPIGKDAQRETIELEDGTRQVLDKYGVPMWEVYFEADAESPKLDALIRIWKKVQEPIVAATNSQKFAELAVGRLNDQGIRAFEWSGMVPQAERDAALKRFEAGEIDIIVGQTAAIGTGIDGLQAAAGVLVSLNKSRDLSDETQLEGRLDRRGQVREDGVVHYELVAEDTTDSELLDRQIEQRFSLNRSLQRRLR